MKETYTPAEADILVVGLPSLDVISGSGGGAGGESGGNTGGGGSGNFNPGAWG